MMFRRVMATSGAAALRRSVAAARPVLPLGNQNVFASYSGHRLHLPIASIASQQTFSASRLFSSKAQHSTVAATSDSDNNDEESDRLYHWITPEAQHLISRAYNRHKALADKHQAYPPALNAKELESLGDVYHFVPKTFRDKVAFKIVQFMEWLMHMFFREKYDHHAVTLETVAAVPVCSSVHGRCGKKDLSKLNATMLMPHPHQGIVASFHRHLRSLRSMRRDNGWINPLQEEAENERMHLLIWMQVTKPSFVERAFVLFAQGLYVAFYSVLYATSSSTAHRSIGYLEECAHRAYNDYLKAVDNGDIPNRPAPAIAIQYYRLPPDATLRDVILHVRADECMHRDFNHMLSERIEDGKMVGNYFYRGCARCGCLRMTPENCPNFAVLV